jgi:UDP-3-O-[3-hydroxymyristoyl] glucosamine N-acyltransferase
LGGNRRDRTERKAPRSDCPRSIRRTGEGRARRERRDRNASRINLQPLRLVGAGSLQLRLGELATRLGVAFHGDPERTLERVATLTQADERSVSFLANPKYRRHLQETRAGAVVLSPSHLEGCPTAALLTADPQLTFARVVRLLYPEPEVPAGRHPSAVVAESARVHPSAWIGPTVVIEDEAEIGARVFVGPGCVIGKGCVIGEDSRLVARVTLCWGTLVGRRALIQPGAVIGGDGFGFARDGERWLRIPQIGRVRLGDDVEVGANTTIDRGALEETWIADGVKLDNLIQIGHNVTVGENTAMAACSGISGSTRIGRNCTIGGAVGTAGHLEIADNVHFTGMAMVTRSVTEPGVYSSGIPAMPNGEWRKTVVRIRRLDEMERRIKALEEGSG